MKESNFEINFISVEKVYKGYLNIPAAAVNLVTRELAIKVENTTDYADLISDYLEEEL